MRRASRSRAAFCFAALLGASAVSFVASAQKLRREKRIVFRYTTADGQITADANPNGSLDNIAGVCSPGRNVLGMMPHPENHVEASMGRTDGRGLFAGLVNHFKAAA